MNNIIFNDILNVQRPRRPRQYRHRPSQLLDTFTDTEIRDRYRFDRDNIRWICDWLRDDLQRPTNRNHALSVEIQVLVSLRFLASGSFIQVTSDVFGIDKSTYSRVVRDFVTAVVNKRNDFIYFPRDADEKDEIKKAFFNLGGFPSTIGCVDGVHVPVKNPPSDDEASYVNRKGWHSINVQGIADANYVFRNVVAKWPGSSHDSFIFRTSNIYEYFEENLRLLDDGLILGDSGYALSRYLMTPYSDPVTPAQKRFNNAHKSTRGTVERAFGQLKRRFPCLSLGLRLRPNKWCKVIVACFVLHNIAKSLYDPDFEDVDGYICEEMPEGNNNNNHAGIMVREHITRTFF